MRPLPWSHSALEDFKNCPRAYHAKRVEKSVVETKGEATIWGEKVHKHFEERLKDGVVLPSELETHEAFIAELEALPGAQLIEHRIALNLSGQPCEFFADNVWYRGVIDYAKINGSHARVIDWKTGKVHQKLQQLYLFALHTFIAHPEIETIRSEFYWTQARSTWGVNCDRSRIPELWGAFLPDLKQYAQAFQTDTWQPRPSGLCKRHCPVTDCEFNGLGNRR